MKNLKDKFMGTILWSAIGDALGSSFEFRSLYNIQADMQRAIERMAASLNPDDPLESLTALIKKRNITDDTLMTLYQARDMVKNAGFKPESTATAFVQWILDGDYRGIGSTTHAAINNLRRGIDWTKSGKTGKQAAGNGPAMRISPVALFYHENLDELAKHCEDSSRITHNCDEAFAGTKATAYAIASAVNHTIEPNQMLLKAAEYCGPSDTADKLKLGHNLLQNKTGPVQALQKIGCGGYIAETAASAIYCFAFSPEEPITTLLNAVSAGGDTDTTAAVAGAITGAWNGAKNIPAQWVQPLDYRDDILKAAEGLYETWNTAKA